MISIYMLVVDMLLNYHHEMAMSLEAKIYTWLLIGWAMTLIDSHVSSLRLKRLSYIYNEKRLSYEICFRHDEAMFCLNICTESLCTLMAWHDSLFLTTFTLFYLRSRNEDCNDLINHSDRLFTVDFSGMLLTYY